MGYSFFLCRRAHGGPGRHWPDQGESARQPADWNQRCDVPLRSSQQAIENVRLLSPSGERVSLAQLTKVEVKDGAYDIYREGNSRYCAVIFNVRDRDLGTTLEDAIKQIGQKVKLPPGYSLGWSGEYESEKRAEKRLAIAVPLTILVIFIILYSMFRSYKWALLINAQSDYRTVQINYLTLIGAYLTSVAQLNQAVGLEVIP